jgi:hypothetical protein
MRSDCKPGGTKIVGIGITAIGANRSGLRETYIARLYAVERPRLAERSDITTQQNVSFQGKAAVMTRTSGDVAV